MGMGLHATFMAKPFSWGASNGGHTNHSLWTTDASGVRTNAFYDAESVCTIALSTCSIVLRSHGYHHSCSVSGWCNYLFGLQADKLSQTAKYWIGGLLRHLPAFQALGSPTMSCYNRVADWTWAPTSAIWVIAIRQTHEFQHQNVRFLRYQFAKPTMTIGLITCAMTRNRALRTERYRDTACLLVF